MEQEKFTTLFDFCESQENENEIAGKIKKILGKAGKIICIASSAADKEIETNHVNQLDAKSLAISLDALRTRTDCCQCLNGKCQFRRKENLNLPETKQDQYYQPTAELWK